MKQYIKMCSQKTGCEENVANEIIETFLDLIVEELSHGNTVDLGPEFGVFSARLRESHLTENSPRTPKDSHYKVVFREGRGMQKRLKVDTQKQETSGGQRGAQDDE